MLPIHGSHLIIRNTFARLYWGGKETYINSLSLHTHLPLHFKCKQQPALLSLHIIYSFISYFFTPLLWLLTMKSFTLLGATLAAYASVATAVSVYGSAEGFAEGVTGGGSATAVYPDTIDELVSYLGDDEARVIVLTKT